MKGIGACNCIKVLNGQLYGFNTDVIGFRESLSSRLKPHHTRALILGTGGAAKAVAYALDQLAIKYQIVSRKEQEGLLNYEALNEKMLSAHTLIVNTTPLGMYPQIDTFPPIDYSRLTSDHLLFDLVYNPERTAFLEKGSQFGADVMNGHEMLLIQAKESWRIWND